MPHYTSSETITIKGTLKSGLTRGTVVTNTASVEAGSPTDPTSNNNSASASFTVIVPDFSVSVVSPITIVVGGSGTSTVSVGSVDSFSSPVGLTASGPSGFQERFSQTPITPLGNGSATATLTINLGTSVTAGSYTVRLTAASGPLTHSTSVDVVVKTTLAAVANVVSAYQALGCIDNSGIAAALTSKLSTAQAGLNAGQTLVEINTLNAMDTQLYAQAGRHIQTACTDGSGASFNPDAALISDTNDMLLNAGAASMIADPITGYVLNAAGLGVAGVSVSILNSAHSVLATATTDISGFYYFPATGALIPGAGYTVRVSVPKVYKSSTPTSRFFSWAAASLAINSFVLN